MKVSAHFYAAVPNGIRNILKVIHCKFLWYHINYLVARRYIGFVLIIYKLVYFTLLYFFISILPYNISPGLQAFNVMPCNTNIHFCNRKIWIAGITIFQGSLYCLNSLVNVQHHAVLHTVAVSPAKAKNFKLAEFIFSTCDCGNFCCANVEAYDNGLFAVHNCCFIYLLFYECFIIKQCSLRGCVTFYIFIF